VIFIISIVGFIFEVSWSFTQFISTPQRAQLSCNCTNTS